MQRTKLKTSNVASGVPLFIVIYKIVDNVKEVGGGENSHQMFEKDLLSLPLFYSPFITSQSHWHKPRGRIFDIQAGDWPYSRCAVEAGHRLMKTPLHLMMELRLNS